MMFLAIIMGSSFAADGAEELQSLVSRTIRSHVADLRMMDIADVDVGVLGMQVQNTCAGDPSVEVSSMPGEQCRGLTRFRVEISTEGKVCGRFTITPRIDLYAEVPVAKQSYEAGERVEFEARRMALASIRGTVVNPLGGNYVATRPVLAGEPLTHRRVKREPAAATGQGVDIIISVGGITIKAEGRMLADANLGERVRVANLATDTVVQGILMEPNIVRAGGR